MVMITKRATRQHAEGTDGVLARLNEPTKPKRPRKLIGPAITPENMEKAIKGSCGLIRRVAARLMCHSGTVRAWLNRIGHEKYREMLREEAESFVDAAEHTVYKSMTQDYDPRTALNAARFVLERKGRDRGWQKEVVIQGGDRPILHQHAVIDVTSLPIEIRRELLTRLESENKEAIPAETIPRALPAPTPAPVSDSLSSVVTPEGDDDDNEEPDNDESE